MRVHAPLRLPRVSSRLAALLLLTAGLGLLPVAVGSQAAGSQRPRLPLAASAVRYPAPDQETGGADPVIVAFGDSITYGMHAPAGESWPDDLARLLQGVRVVNRGINGNRLVTSPTNCRTCGTPGVDRFGRDVLAVPHVRIVLLALGINDLLQGNMVANVEAADRLLVAEAHASHLLAIGVTLTPDERVVHPAGIARLQQVNSWIRTSGAFDGVVDAYAALVDPHRPGYLLPAYDSGDGLHPNARGYLRLARAVYTLLYPLSVRLG